MLTEIVMLNYIIIMIMRLTILLSFYIMQEAKVVVLKLKSLKLNLVDSAEIKFVSETLVYNNSLKKYKINLSV